MIVRAMLVMTLTAVPAVAQETVAIPARDVALEGDPTDVYVVGALDGAEWEMFSNVRSVGFDRADNLYVLDGQNLRVLVFDRAGEYVRQFGKRGGGPGELQAPMSMTVMPNDEIVINDLGNRAYITFSPTGEFIRTVPHAASLGMPLGSLQPHPLGILTRANPTPMMSAEGGRRVASLFVQPMVTDAQPITLLELPLPELQQLDVSGGSGSRRVAAVSMDPVFGARASYATLADGTTVLHHETEYSIRVLDRNGQSLRTLTRAIEPRRVTGSDRERWQERRASGEGGAPQTIAITATSGSAGSGTSVTFGGGRSGGGAGSGGGAPGGPIALDLDNIPFAEFMSVVTGLRADPQGRIWVQRRNTDALEAGPIDLLTREGRYIGTLPPQPLPGAFSATGLAAYVVRDELDVERVKVVRLPASWR